jgi:hypothetical protein
MMSHRRRFSTLFLLVAALALAPGRAYAHQAERTPAVDESAVARFVTWMERAWDSLTGSTPAANSTVLRCGAGMDPNGTCLPIGGGGGGTTSSSGGH